MIRAPIAIVSLFALALPALAQTTSQPAPADPPRKIRSVMLSAGQKCPPPSSPDEVVVCGNLEDQYRIPKELRNEGPIAPPNQSWAAKQSVNDEVGREAGGLPNTCSPVGTGGQTGCTQVMLNRSRDDARRGADVPPRR